MAWTKFNGTAKSNGTTHTSSKPTKDHGNSNQRLLRFLIALAFGTSVMNFAIGGQHVKSIHKQQQQQPQSTTNNHQQSPVEHHIERRHTKQSENTHVQNNRQQKVHDGKFITQILRGKKPFPRNKGNTPPPLPHRLKYRPGSLQLSHAQSLQHCYVNTTHYQNHIAQRAQSLMSVSDRYKIIYRNNPKASSSSARHAMMDFLEGGDVRMKHDDMETKVHDRGYSMVSFIREPLNRFYSSYDEAFFRMGPWMEKGSIVRDKPRVRQQYLNNKWRVDPYPYLYDGFTTIDDFREMYCPMEVLRTGRFLDCNEIPSIDDGNLVHRFEQFVADYSGLDPFDIHLNLQISNLVFPSGEPFPITTLYNSTEAERGWQELASKRGVDIPDGEMTHGRRITRRFNVSKVSDATKRKICKILVLDYCCLNIELPEECRGVEGDEDDDAVYCALERRDEETMKYALEPFVIHAWEDP